uniref:Uncharacterized protein n=1 Tax=Ascaris lumbricoides TaxID=6252 RepID=A0A9J2P4I0_ASCLU
MLDDIARGASLAHEWLAGSGVAVLDAFERKLNAARDYSNNIERIRTSATTERQRYRRTVIATVVLKKRYCAITKCSLTLYADKLTRRSCQLQTDIMSNRRRYVNGAVVSHVSKVDSVENGDVAGSNRPSHNLVGDMNGNNELKRRRTQSFSPEKKATRIPVPKSVLYPALLDYIRSKVPKATSATENAPAFKEGSNEAKQQFPTSFRNESQRTKRARSNVEEIRRKVILGEVNSEAAAGGSIERPLRRSRSHLGFRTKPPEPLSRWTMIEQGVARKVTQIRASPKLKFLLKDKRCAEGDIRRRISLNLTYAKSPIKSSSSWKSFSVDRALLRFQQLLEPDAPRDSREDSMPIQRRHSMHAGESDDLIVEIRRDDLQAKLTTNSSEPSTSASNNGFRSKPSSVDTKGIDVGYPVSASRLLPRSNVGIQTTADENRVERSAGESDSNGAVSERSMSDVGVHKRTEEEHTDSLRTSGKGNRKAQSSASKRAGNVRRLKDARGIDQHSVKKKLRRGPAVSAGSSTSSRPTSTRSDFLQNSSSDLQQSSNSDAAHSSYVVANYVEGSDTASRFHKEAKARLRSPKQNFYQNSNLGSGKHSSHHIARLGSKRHARRYETQAKDPQGYGDSREFLQPTASDDHFSPTMSLGKPVSLYLTPSQESRKDWSGLSRTNTLDGDVQRSLNTLDELTANIERASKFFDASFAGRASISACEQVTTDAIAKSESLKCYAVTPIVGAVITPVRRSSEVNITRGKALGGRLNAHLAYSERIDHMGEQLRDARNIFKMSEKVPPPLEALRNEEASGNHQNERDGCDMVVLPREVDDYGSAYRWRRLGESDGDIVSLHSLSIADTDPQKRVLFHFSFILANDFLSRRTPVVTGREAVILNIGSLFEGAKNALLLLNGPSPRVASLFSPRRSSFNGNISLTYVSLQKMLSPMKAVNADRRNIAAEGGEKTESWRHSEGKENEPKSGTTRELFSYDRRSTSIRENHVEEPVGGANEADGDDLSISPSTAGEESVLKDRTSFDQLREELSSGTIAALRQYYCDLCVFYHMREKELMNANKFVELEKLVEERRLKESGCFDLKRTYENSKGWDISYDEYFKYHTHETARLHLLSLKLRDRLRWSGKINEESAKQLDETKRKTEKVLRLTATGVIKPPSSVCERKEVEQRRLRRERLSRTRGGSLSKDVSSLGDGELSSISDVNVSLTNRGPVKLLGKIAHAEVHPCGSFETGEDRVNMLRNELKQKREEALVLRESFDRRVRDGGTDHSIRDLSVKAENSVLEQIKAHESYIQETANHIAYLEKLEVEQLSVSTTSNNTHQSGFSLNTENDAVSPPTTETASMSHLLSAACDVIADGEHKSSPSRNSSSSSRTSTLVPDSPSALHELDLQNQDVNLQFPISRFISPQKRMNQPASTSLDSEHLQPSDRMPVSVGGTVDAKRADRLMEMSASKGGTPKRASFSESPDASSHLKRVDELKGSLEGSSVKNAFMTSQEAEESDEDGYQDTFEELPLLEPANSSTDGHDNVGMNRILPHVLLPEGPLETVVEIAGQGRVNEERVDQMEDSMNLSDLDRQEGSQESDHCNPPNERAITEVTDIGVKKLSQPRSAQNGTTLTSSDGAVNSDAADVMEEKDLPGDILRISGEPGSVLDSLTNDDLECFDELEVAGEQEETSARKPSVPKLDLNGIDDSDQGEASAYAEDVVSDRKARGEDSSADEIASGRTSSERTVVESEVTQPFVMSSLKHPDADSLAFCGTTTGPPDSIAPEEEVSKDISKDLIGVCTVDGSADMRHDEILLEETKMAVATTGVPTELDERSDSQSTSDDVDSECFFTDVAPSPELPAFNHEAESEELRQSGSDKATLLHEITLEASDQLIDGDVTERGSCAVTEQNVNSLAKFDVGINAEDKLLILARSPELVTDVLNDSAMSFTRPPSFEKERTQSEESGSHSVIREKRKRFSLSLSPLSSPRSPLISRFATTMPPHSRTPRTPASTSQSPRKDVRMASSLGKFLMDESLNDSLSTMLSIMAERRTSLDGANASFVESISANAELDANQTEKKATVRNSWLEHSWMDDATYDLNNIAEPKNLFNVTPLDLSEMNADEETKSEVEVTDPTSLGNRPLVLPDITCDTPLPKRYIKRTSDIVDDTQKRFYCDDPDEVRAVIGEYAERVWSMFSAGENLQIEVDATEVGEHPARTAHRQMIADACCAIAQRTFQRDLHNVWMSHGVPLPPQDIFELKATLRTEVFNVLYPDSEKSMRKSRWETISRDNDLKFCPEKYALTKLVMDQLYRDQDRWRNFEPIEESIKEEMAADLFREQVAESFAAVNVSSKSLL